jgi:hypothetical protein
MKIFKQKKQQGMKRCKMDFCKLEDAGNRSGDGCVFTCDVILSPVMAANNLAAPSTSDVCGDITLAANMADKSQFSFSHQKPDNVYTTDSEPIETTMPESENICYFENATDSSQCIDLTNDDVALVEDYVFQHDVSTNHVAAMIGSHVACDSDTNAAKSDAIDDVASYGTPPATVAEMAAVEERWEGLKAGQVCTVCGDKADGMYFGALVCLPCKVRASRPIIIILLIIDYLAY